jgi:hypothetical protein
VRHAESGSRHAGCAKPTTTYIPTSLWAPLNPLFSLAQSLAFSDTSTSTSRPSKLVTEPFTRMASTNPKLPESASAKRKRAVSPTAGVSAASAVSASSARTSETVEEVKLRTAKRQKQLAGKGAVSRCACSHFRAATCQHDTNETAKRACRAAQDLEEATPGHHHLHVRAHDCGSTHLCSSAASQLPCMLIAFNCRACIPWTRSSSKSSECPFLLSSSK